MLPWRLSSLLMKRKPLHWRSFSDQTSKNSDFPFDKPVGAFLCLVWRTYWFQLLKWKPLEKAEEEINFNERYVRSLLQLRISHLFDVFVANDSRLRLVTDCIVLGATGLVIYKMGYRFLYGPPER